MNAPKFSPGPWVKDKYGCLGDSNGRQVLVADCGLGFASGHEAPERVANARLIKAAPTMYAALAYAVDNPDFDSAEFDRMARAALTEAVQS